MIYLSKVDMHFGSSQNLKHGQTKWDGDYLLEKSQALKQTETPIRINISNLQDKSRE